MAEYRPCNRNLIVGSSHQTLQMAGSIDSGRLRMIVFSYTFTTSGNSEYGAISLFTKYWFLLRLIMMRASCRISSLGFCKAALSVLRSPIGIAEYPTSSFSIFQRARSWRQSSSNIASLSIGAAPANAASPRLRSMVWEALAAYIFDIFSSKES